MLPAFIESACAVLEKLLPDQYEIIVVDDDSTDGTWRRALAMGVRFPAIRVVNRTEESGLATAVVRGWQVARALVIGVIDADLQHPPEVCGQLWEAIRRGADLAVASRHVPGGGVSDWSLRRRFLSRAAQAFGLIFLPSVLARVTDPMSGLFFLRRSVIEDIELAPEGYKILVEVLGRGRVQRIAEVPFVFRERKRGGSKANVRVYLEFVRHVFRLRRDLPTQSRLVPRRS